ncbi:Flp pilus assembly protein CpaB [Erythrobacter sp. JK5]|uniref:Flp pilus assembly protein CpaB n=1 Tax=Erythrobacter sp. JK5 TaxID=2829500 RepID=UPI001BA6A71A|nr:Flp pilus assembly protein CpaB [Erythrobacter sp. JK5]QUL38120.1 Flp pilus assembly protein CpaB [Erythrobacter sp. JK5]
MRGRNLLIVGAAVFFGLIAVYLANAYFSGYESRQEQTAQDQRMVRIVVASQDMEFGAPLTSTNTRLANWPSDSIPAGAFTSIEDATRGGRVALRPIVAGEAVLANRVSGEGGRATLASVLPEELRAVSIPVNEVAGVGGFVRAGDVVDVMLTRQIPGEGAGTTDKMTTVVLENVLVLAVDQTANENETEPTIGKTATLQTDLYGSQKLALATQIGTLSMALRNVENQVVGSTRAVLPRDLGGEGIYIPARQRSAAISPQPVASAPRERSTSASTPAPVRYRGPSMTVVRGVESQDYRVKRYGGY